MADNIKTYHEVKITWEAENQNQAVLLLEERKIQVENVNYPTATIQVKFNKSKTNILNSLVMKRSIQLSLMALLCAIQFEILAQEVENQLPKNTQNWMDEDWPITDSLAFELPNQGKLLILFNAEEHNPEDLTLKFKPILKKATDFPEFKTITYRLAEAFPQTSLDRVLLNIEKLMSLMQTD